MRTWVTLGVVLVVVLEGGCGPSVGDDAGSGGSTEAGDGATAGATEATSKGSGGTAVDESSTGMPVDCDALSEDQCSSYEECETVSGVELMPTDVPGEYECSDIKEPFACTQAGCEMVQAIICKTDEPTVAVWLTGDCIPEGWEVCDEVMCM